MIWHTGHIDQEQLAVEIERVKLKLGPEVVRLMHNVGPDMDGDPSIFIRVVLTDAASREEILADVTWGIAKSFFDELRPQEVWGLYPYFSFRSHSEQPEQNDSAWN